jgi:hypothetical protein
MCGSNALIALETAQASKTYPSNEFTVTVLKTIGSNPEWASFGIEPTPGFIDTVQGAVGVAECTQSSGWQTKDFGSVFVGCNVVPPSVLSQLGSGFGCPPSTPTSGNSGAFSVLAPATTAPVVDECSLPITTAADGNVSPLTCLDGGVNVLAWNQLASDHPVLMTLGPGATPTQVEQAACTDLSQNTRTIPITVSTEEIAAVYYGWKFPSDPLDGGLYLTEGKCSNGGSTGSSGTTGNSGIAGNS